MRARRNCYDGGDMIPGTIMSALFAVVIILLFILAVIVFFLPFTIFGISRRLEKLRIKDPGN